MSPNRKRKRTGPARTRLIVCACCAAMAPFFFRCASPDMVAGTGSQAGNGRIACVIHNSDGTPASGASVYLRPRGYTADTAGAALGKRAVFRRDARTDAFGALTIDSVDTGSYCIEVNDGKSHAVALTCSVTENDSLVRLPDDTLKPTGVIEGAIVSTPGASVVYVQVYGLERIGIRDGGSGGFIVNDVPGGSYVLRVQTSSADYRPVDIGGVAVAAGISTDVGKIDFIHRSGWRYSKKVYMNTTPSGAGISGVVTNFPILIRLRADNFDFSQAQAEGGDLLFAKADGTPLPCQIERWDAVAKSAEAWIKVDTIQGNDSSQYIAMYWGASTISATSPSNGSAVFDSAGGFQGVWHLNETSGARASDASCNGFTGIYRGGLPKGEYGPLGICQNIARPDTDYVDIGNVLNPGMKDISIGVWLKRAALGMLQALIAKTNGNTPSAAYGYLLTFDASNNPHFYMATGGTSWGDEGAFDVVGDLAITDTATWHYVFVVINRSDNALCKMYIDGIDRTGAIAGNVTRIAAVTNALSFHIGTESDNNCSYTGAIGEATLTFTARSADWVKLSYMNQKGGDRLLAFGKE